MKVAVLGCGNVGFNTLRAFSTRGYQVYGYDPLPQMRERVAETFGSDASLTDLTDVATVDAVFMCVPTDPLPLSGAADLTIIRSLVRELSLIESSSEWSVSVVVQRSTCPPGTAAQLAASFKRTLFAVNPSFLSKETQWEDSNNPPRIAYGGPEQATKILDRLYEEFPGSPRYVSSSFEAVELLKYVENTIDTVLISLWNEYLAYADAIGLDRAYFVELCSAIIERDRFATTLRVPGGAFGKWCLPKDLKALLQSFEQHGVDAQVLEGADATNDSVAATVGENPVPTRNLLNLADGRTRLAPVAQDFLLKATTPLPRGGKGG